MAFRKSKKIGIFRFTASKSGLSASVGVPGLRVTKRANGKVTRTVGVPGTGIYDTTVIRSAPDSTTRARRTSAQQHVAPPLMHTAVHTDAVDANLGRRDLLSNDSSITKLKVVGVSGKIADVAAQAGVLDKPNRCAIRVAVLLPAAAGDYNVVVLIYPEDNPALFSRSADNRPQGVPFGRIGKADLRRWGAKFAGRSIQTVVFIDGTPGLEWAEIRFFPGALDE